MNDLDDFRCCDDLFCERTYDLNAPGTRVECSSTYFLLQLRPLQRKHARDHRQRHKVVILQQLRRGESRQRIHEQLARAFELSN